MVTIEKKLELRRLIREMGSVLVTLSGGIDSTLLAKVAFQELGQKALAMTAVSPSLARQELEECKQIAAEIGIPHLLFETRELDNPQYAANPGNRCYFCKEELFTTAVGVAKEKGIAFVLEGTHVEDLSGHRPGFQAAREQGIRSPFVEAGFTKEDIRRFAQELGLSNWDKPALACLSSRFPTGTEITLERLRLIDEMEQRLRGLGLRQCRARYHGDLLRVELGEEEIDRLGDPDFREALLTEALAEGFRQVAIDLMPYGHKAVGSPVSLPLEESELLGRLRTRMVSLGCEECWLRSDSGMAILALPKDKVREWLGEQGIREEAIRFSHGLGFKHLCLDLVPLQLESLSESPAMK